MVDDSVLVEDAIGRLLGGFPDQVSGSPEAALALSLGRQIDQARNATAAANAAGRLLDCLDKLRALAPEEREVTPLDEIRARRDLRKRQAAAKD